MYLKTLGNSEFTCVEGAVRYARPFDYQHEATTLLPNSDFLSLPDHVTQYGPVRAQTLGLHIPDSIKVWLLSGAPRIYRTDLDLPGNRHVALPSILKRYFCSELTITQFAELLIARQAEDEKILDTAATACRKMKRAKQTLARLPHPTASFFCSLLLRCDLLAKKVPGRAPYSQHIMIRNWT